jgi:hypothetical protein
MPKIPWVKTICHRNYLIWRIKAPLFFEKSGCKISVPDYRKVAFPSQSSAKNVSHTVAAL